MVGVGRFALWVALLGLVLVGMVWILLPTVAQLPDNAAAWAVGAVTTCGLLTLAVFWVANRGLHGRIQQFTTALMGASMAKMFLSAILIAAVAFTARPYLTVFVGAYFTAYFPYTALEVWTLLRNLRKGAQA